MTKEEATKILKDFHDKSALFSVRTALETLCPELKESEDERIRNLIYCLIRDRSDNGELLEHNGCSVEKALAWLEKQGEQKPTQEIEPFEAEHGKYYYCIKDYFCGGRKQASKGDVVQALRGLPIMGLKDASEYFLPVNSIKRNSAWSEEDDDDAWINDIISKVENNLQLNKAEIDWLKSLRPQSKQEWSEEDEKKHKEDMEWIKGMLEELNKKTFKPPFDIKTSPRPIPAPFDPWGQVCLYACPTAPYDPNITASTTNTLNKEDKL